MSEETVRRKGGRRKGDSGHRNDGLFKRCGCSRKRWSECLDDWWCSWATDHQSFRFNLTKRAGLPRKKAMGRTEMEPIREQFRTLAREGKIDRRGKLIEPDITAADQKTLRSVADDFVAHWKSDPNRRAHRLKPLQKHLNGICRTVVGDRPFGTRVFADLRTADIEAFRDARRQLLRAREAELEDRRRRIAAGETDARKIQVGDRTAPRPPRRGGVSIERWSVFGL